MLAQELAVREEDERQRHDARGRATRQVCEGQWEDGAGDQEVERDRDGKSQASKQRGHI